MTRRGALRRAVRVAASIVAIAPLATRLASAQVASSAPPGGVQPEPARVEPWSAGLSNGLEELERRIAAGDHAGVRDLVRRLEAPDALARRRAEWIAAGAWRASALRAIDPAIELLRLRPRAAAIAGELALVDGVAALGLEQWEQAQAAFLLARAEGSGATRLEAVDALADLELAAAEALRPGPDGSAPAAAQVATPPGGANPNAPASAAGPAEDPIAKARAAYLVARARLVERLRLERHDADARANLELVQRRLEELRRLEEQRRREEEERRREQQEQQDKDKDKDEQERQPEDQQGQDQQEQPEEEQQDQRQPSEADESKADDQAPKPAAAMSKEEAQKLLDKLKELEEKGEELRATLLKDRRQKVDKDW
ncbi:MAG: hypothetical protein RIR65_1418 [Planctomycetota bacterium]